MIGLILMLGGALLLACGILFYLKSKKKLLIPENRTKKNKRRNKLSLILIVISAYMILTGLVKLLYPQSASKGIEVKIWAERTTLFGFDISKSVIYTWIIMLVIVAIAVILRLTVVRRMKECPKGIQNVLETCVGGISDYAESQAKGLGNGLSAYLFSIAVFMIGCAVLEMFGLRSPTSDITVTFAMALITFILINYYGIRRKGVGGRIKSLAKPTPIVLPMKIVSDFAIPVSLSCRLFGNMLGGMIVMDLLYSAMGSYGIGLPGVVGLYFNVFHPLIQAFIFVTLSLTFINEATE